MPNFMGMYYRVQGMLSHLLAKGVRWCNSSLTNACTLCFIYTYRLGFHTQAKATRRHCRCGSTPSHHFPKELNWHNCTSRNACTLHSVFTYQPGIRHCIFTQRVDFQQKAKVTGEHQMCRNTPSHLFATELHQCNYTSTKPPTM